MLRNRDFFSSLYILLLEGLRVKSLYVRNKTQLRNRNGVELFGDPCYRERKEMQITWKCY